jgi:hypothetical protein
VLFIKTLDTKVHNFVLNDLVNNSQYSSKTKEFNFKALLRTELERHNTWEDYKSLKLMLFQEHVGKITKILSEAEVKANEALKDITKK